MPFTPLTAQDLANPDNLNTRLDEIEASLNGLSGNTPGVMVDYAGSAAPDGWLMCDGSAVSRATYAALFAVIGTAYGVGDGITTFNLPDMRGRTAIGAGQGVGLTNRVLGTLLGEENHQLTIPELPAHHHGTGKNVLQANQFLAGVAGYSAQDMVTTSNMVSTGSDQSHNNMQPSLALNAIIKV